MRVFISYQNEDEVYARHIGQQLSVRGHEVAFYPHIVNEPEKVLAEALRHANLLLLTVGHMTSKSAWVASEIFAAGVIKLPIIAILLDENSFPPDTLPLNTPVAAYPSLIETQFALFDIFPSRKMRSEQWRKIRVKISPYQHPIKLIIPDPLIDRKSILNISLLALGFICAGASYLIGLFLPSLVFFLIEMFKGTAFSITLASSSNRVREVISIIWLVIFTLILFYRPRKRLPYPIWVLWFFKDYIPAWLSIRNVTVRKEMNKVMQRLSSSSGNQTYWVGVEAQRTGKISLTATQQHKKNLFLLLSTDERRCGPYGELDEKGLYDIHQIVHNIPGFEIGLYGRSEVMIKHSPEEVEIISPSCPTPYCLCGKSVRLKKVNGTWEIVSKNW